jgi:hypothetical protein
LEPIHSGYVLTLRGRAVGVGCASRPWLAAQATLA